MSFIIYLFTSLSNALVVAIKICTSSLHLSNTFDIELAVTGFSVIKSVHFL